MKETETNTATAHEQPRPTSRLPGLALVVAIAIVATGIGKLFPIVGGPVSGIIIGVLLAVVIKPGLRLRPGIILASGFILQLSVVLLGSQLSLSQIVEVGVSSLPVMIGTLIACLVGAYWIGRFLGIVGDLRTLIGVGTGICGASAIAAVTPIIGAASIEVAYAISTIFLFNIAAVLAFPIIGHALGMSQHAFGLFAGTAVNDTSSVVAAAATYGSQATNYAVVVKLTRTLLIIPICFGLAILADRKDRAAAVAAAKAAAQESVTEVMKASGKDSSTDSTTEAAHVDESVPRSRVRLTRLVPWFLTGFVLVAAANTVGIIPTSAHGALAEASVFLITIALAAIGLSTDLVGLRRTGPRPLILGGSLWVLVAATSLGLQALTGTI